MLLPVVLSALAVAGVAYLIVDMMTKKRYVDPHLGRFEVRRRERLREASTTYRWFEPWVDELKSPDGKDLKDAESVRQDLLAAGISAPWKPEEFLATKRVEACFASILGAGLGWIMGGTTAAVLFMVVVFVVYQAMARRLLKSEATRRKLKMKRRFAAVIDLMALMMEVGAGFQESLKVAAEESKGHPLGDELAIVRRDITMGKRDDALRAFAERTQDEDIAEVVSAIVEGEELGTPLAKIFRTQAEQMRQKRSQWAEKASAEAEVALVFPAMLIMVACLIIVAAPFVLSAVFAGG